MKNIILLLLTLCILASCSKDNISTPSAAASNSSTTSHYCGYPTKTGPCQRKVAGATGYCWQHK